MIASSIITAISLPIYAGLHHSVGVAGLAMASNIGIAMQTCTIAVLLHQRRMVSLASLDYPELGRCLVAALAGGVGAWLAVRGVGAVHALPFAHSVRWIYMAELVLGTAVWLPLTILVLEKTGSALPRVALKRLRLR